MELNLDTQASTAKPRSFNDLHYFWLYGISHIKLTRVRTTTIGGLEHAVLIFTSREGVSCDHCVNF